MTVQAKSYKCHKGFVQVDRVPYAVLCLPESLDFRFDKYTPPMTTFKYLENKAQPPQYKFIIGKTVWLFLVQKKSTLAKEKLAEQKTAEDLEYELKIKPCALPAYQSRCIYTITPGIHNGPIHTFHIQNKPDEVIKFSITDLDNEWSTTKFILGIARSFRLKNE